MTTNKTPIQELMLFFDTAIKNSKRKEVVGILSTLRTVAEASLQKEKAFAFDCFEAGKSYGIDYSLSVEDGMPSQRPTFDEFYSQYAEQHID